MNNKILVMGHARHGKDTFCEMLRDRGLKFQSSSQATLDHAIWPHLKGFYNSKEECFEDRVNHRSLWFTLTRYFNTPDKSKLAKIILAENDIYCGIRNREEFEACKHLFKHIIWVDALERKEPEPADSFELSESDANYIINNNGDTVKLNMQAYLFMQYYYANKHKEIDEELS